MDTSFCQCWQGDERTKYCRECATIGEPCYKLWQIVLQLAEQQVVFTNNRPGLGHGNKYRIESPKGDGCYLQMLQGQKSRVRLPIEDFLYVTITGQGGKNQTPSGTKQFPFVDLLLEIIKETENGADLIEAVKDNNKRKYIEADNDGVYFDDSLLFGPAENYSWENQASSKGNCQQKEIHPYANWEKALKEYSYSVDLFDYPKSEQFLGFFNKTISGDRESTITFENYFRDNAVSSIEVYFEVIFWKIFSLFKKGYTAALVTADEKISYMQNHAVDPAELLYKIEQFVREPQLDAFRAFRELLGLKRENGSLPIAATFPAFIDPANFPMIDRRVAYWINKNREAQNRNTKAKLSTFPNLTSIQDCDFYSYINWVYWCREAASRLRQRTTIEWRARDVEMAVFTASIKSIELEFL